VTRRSVTRRSAPTVQQSSRNFFTCSTSCLNSALRTANSCHTRAASVRAVSPVSIPTCVLSTEQGAHLLNAVGGLSSSQQVPGKLSPSIVLRAALISSMAGSIAQPTPPSSCGGRASMLPP